LDSNVRCQARALFKAGFTFIAVNSDTGILARQKRGDPRSTEGRWV